MSTWTGRIASVVLGAACAPLLLAGCGHTGSNSAATSSTSAYAPAAAATVEVKNMAFTPASVTVHTGAAVVWKFDDRFPHSVMGTGADSLTLDSPIVSRGEWSHTFTAPGAYAYTCQLHPDMHGTVVVVP